MIETEYLTAWAVYLAASLVFLVVWYLITAAFNNAWIRMILRMPAIALLLTPLHMPTHTMAVDNIYSPAIAAFCIDLLAGHIDQAMYTLPYLATSVIILLLFGALYVYCFSPRKG